MHKKILLIISVFPLIILLLFSCRKDPVTETFDISEGQSNWKKIPFDTIQPNNEFSELGINKICFVNNQIGFLAGYKTYHESSSVIYKTLNSGNTWVPNYGYKCAVGSVAHSIFFSSQSHGFSTFSCFGKGFSETLNCGLTWTKKINDATNDAPNQHFVIDSLNIIVGNLKTSDGGLTWQTIAPPAQTTCYFFRNINYGICATENGLISKTYNFGDTWDTLYYCNSCKFYSIIETDSLTIIAGGNKIIRSTDKGQTWIETYSKSYVNDIKFINKNIGFAAISSMKFPDFAYIGNSDINGSILKTTDGGNTWSVNYNSSFMGFKSLCILNTNTIICAGFQSNKNEQIKNGFIVKTTTQGE